MRFRGGSMKRNYKNSKLIRLLGDGGGWGIVRKFPKCISLANIWIFAYSGTNYSIIKDNHRNIKSDMVVYSIFWSF